jgi:5-methylcytosine-specific restriction endonuclease McrA
MHILSTAARRWLGSASLWPQLDDLLQNQNGLCAYTGTPLVLGHNASLDHKIPRSRGGEDRIENVQWVTWDVNRSKTDMTHEEFVAMCHVVSKKFPC